MPAGKWRNQERRPCNFLVPRPSSTATVAAAKFSVWGMLLDIRRGLEESRESEIYIRPRGSEDSSGV